MADVFWFSFKLFVRAGVCSVALGHWLDLDVPKLQVASQTILRKGSSASTLAVAFASEQAVSHQKMNRPLAIKNVESVHRNVSLKSTPWYVP